jgi:glucose/arabinose dehydrogenase
MADRVIRLLSPAAFLVAAYLSTSHARVDATEAQTTPAAPQQPADTGAFTMPAGATNGGRGRGRGADPALIAYAQYCSGCHGPDLRGGVGRSLVDMRWQQTTDDAAIVAAIAHGRPGTAMTAFADVLDEQQIRQLVIWLREQGVAAQDKPEVIVNPDGHVVRSEQQTVRMEVVAKDLETPWGLAFLPDGRLLVTERPGRLRVVEKGRLLPPVEGVPPVWTAQDGGLFDVEVHPDYRRNGWIYLSFADPGPEKTSMTEIVRGRLEDNRWVDQKVIYKAPPELYFPTNIHYGSRFAFDKTGHLFYTIGERGHPEDAQDLTKPNGKIHRVNDDGTVPNDNPFASRPGALGSIWSYGHRNPQGLAFDGSGTLWESEHGPRGGDELNLVQPGHNYGWAVVSFGQQPGVAKTEQGGMDAPVVYWTPTIAPSGMAFATAKYPGWKGDLFVASLGGQQLRRLKIEKGKVTHQEVVLKEFGRVRDVIVGPDGLFYVALSLPGTRLSDTTAGVVVRMVPIDK